MREIRLHGSEGGAAETNRSFLPLSLLFEVEERGRKTGPFESTDGTLLQARSFTDLLLWNLGFRIESLRSRVRPFFRSGPRCHDSVRHIESVPR